MNQRFNKTFGTKFEKYWNKFIDGRNYLIPGSIEDIKALGPFPYLHIGNAWIYTKDKLKIKLRECANLILSEIGHNDFSKQTILDAIRDEIKLSISDQRTANEHLEHILDVVRAKNQKRLFIRIISGLTLKDVAEIKYGSWRLALFDNNEINNIIERDVGDEQWKSNVKAYLSKYFKDKLCLFVESQGDEKKAKQKAENIAKYVINTLRYFICCHLSQTDYIHKIGIVMDKLGIDKFLTFFSFNLEKCSSSIHRFEPHSRQEYILTAENLEIIRKHMHGERLWSFIENNDPTDLESSIVSSITWLGDAQQEMDINIAYVKYWIAIEALITGHEKGSKDDSLNKRLKNRIPLMIANIDENPPSKSEVDKAYELRGTVVHSGNKEIVALEKLNKVCKWATECIVMCVNLCNLNYKSRQQVEEQLKKLYLPRNQEDPSVL
ncbi:MAG: hypothetical protein AB1424_11195 [Thermodesulfobacteriota bacterium]